MDTWVEAGSRPPVKTCRFNTRIDYIYATGHLLGDCKETTTSSKLRIKSVRHIPDQASDHNMVIAEMTAAV